MNTTTPLLFKAWRESRGRFLISAALFAAICVIGIFFHVSLMKVFVPDERFVGNPYIGYIYRLVYSGTARGELLPASQTPSLGVMMKPEVANGYKTDVQSGVQA